MDKKVSIIVPVYNVEKYIDECVQSLIGQTYKNLEIILVDDASPDNCGAICDAYAKQDGRIVVIHKSNGGAASARNAGIDVATGDYICFVDSDDAVEAEYVQILVQTMETHQADAAVCGFYFWSQAGQTSCITETVPGVYNCEAYMLRFLQDWSCSLLWNKIFAKEAIGNIRMAEGHRVDDEYFTYQVCMNCKKVAQTDRCLYMYRLRASSAMQDLASVQQKVMLDRIEYNVTRYANVVAKMPQLDEAFFIFTLDTLARYWHHSKDMPVAQQQLRAWINSHFARLLRAKLSLKQKLAYMWTFYMKKPAVMAEPNPIQMDADAYFD